MLEHDGLSALVEELKSNAIARRQRLEFSVRAKKRISFSVSESDPLKLAADNKDYALRFCGQYTRNDPFFLFFVIHPWFSQGNLHQNFDGYTDRFCKEFARLAFHSFSTDTALLEGMEKREITRLLSGIGFINVWQERSSKGRGPSNRIFLNSNARNPLEHKDFASIQLHFGNDLTIDEL